MASDPRGGDCPETGGCEHPVDRDVFRVYSHNIQRYVEREPFPVGVETPAWNTIGPGSQEGDAAEFAQLRNVGGRHVENIRAMNIHGVGAIAEAGRYENFRAVRGIRQPHDVDSVIVRVLAFVLRFLCQFLSVCLARALE